MRGGREDRPLVGFQHGQPVLQVFRMVGARFGGDPDIRAKKCRPELSNEFFARVSFIAKTLPAKVAGQSAL